MLTYVASDNDMQISMYVKQLPYLLLLTMIEKSVGHLMSRWSKTVDDAWTGCQSGFVAASSAGAGCAEVLIIATALRLLTSLQKEHARRAVSNPDGINWLVLIGAYMLGQSADIIALLIICVCLLLPSAEAGKSASRITRQCAIPSNQQSQNLMYSNDCCLSHLFTECPLQS